MYGLIYMPEADEAIRAIEDRAYMVVGATFANLLLNEIESHLENFSRRPSNYEKQSTDLPNLEGMLHPFTIPNVMGYRCDVAIFYKHSMCEMILYLSSIGCEWWPI